MDRRDALVEAGLQRDGIAVRGEAGREALLDGLQGLAGHGAGQCAEEAGHAVQAPARGFQGGNGVVEAGRLGLVRDLLDFTQVLGKGLVEGRLEGCSFHGVERRYLQDAGPGLQEGVGLVGCRQGKNTVSSMNETV